MTGLFSRALARLPHHPVRIGAAAFATALAVRLLYLMAFRRSPFYDQLIVDAQWHDAWAWDWARGAGLEPGAFFRAPLYPLWLSVLYRAFGHDLDAVRVVQALVGAGTAGFIGYSAARWFGRGAGLAAGALAACYGPFIHYDAELLIPNLLLFLLAGSMAMLASASAPPDPATTDLPAGSASPRRAVRAGVAGLLVGLAGIARPNALVLIPLIAWVTWFAWRGSRRRLAATALTLVLAVAPALAVTALNARRESAQAGVATQGGLNFYAGNHAGATGKSLEIPELANLVSWRELVPRARAVAEAGARRELSTPEVSGWWFRRGLEWIRDHPADALGLYGQKLYYLVNAYEIPSDRDLYVHARGILQALLWTVPGLGAPWGLVFPLAVAGFLSFRRHPEWSVQVRFLGLWAVLYAASILPFFVTGRFRLGLVPPILCLAGLALAHPRKTFRGTPLWVGLVTFAIANSAFFGAREVNRAAEAARLGDVLLRDGRTREGLTALEQSYGLDSTRIVTAYLLARGHVTAGEPAQAARYFERVFLARPEDPQVTFDLGTALLAAGDPKRAAWALERSSALDSTSVAAWINLGVAYEDQGKPEWALAAYRRGLSRDPAAETGVVRAAGLLLAEDRASDALPLLEAAIEKNVRSFDLWFSLAVISVAAGDSTRAREALQEAEILRPGDPRSQAFRRTLEAGSRSVP